MVEIKIVVEMPGIPEALNNLADALRGRPALMIGQSDSKPSDAMLLTTTPAAVETAKPAEPVQPGPAITSAPVAASPVPAGPAPVQTPAYTLEQISKAGAAWVDADKENMNKLLALCKNYGIERLTDLPAERFNMFAKDLQLLGVAI